MSNIKYHNYITTTEAMKIAAEKGHEVCRATMIKWFRDFDIGKKIGGMWIVDRDELEKLLDGEYHYD